MDLITLGVQLLNAVQYGAVLFLVASGLTLVFGILGSSISPMARSICSAPIWLTGSR